MELGETMLDSASARAVEEEIEAGAEAAEGVNAAQAEQERGQPDVSVGLLIKAMERERESLDLLVQGFDALRQSFEERRRALEQQEEILNELADHLNS